MSYNSCKCGNRKNRSAFQCGVCHRSTFKFTNQVSIRERNLFYRSGITLAQFNALLERQNFRCAICGTDKHGGKYNHWQVDHDHNCCPNKFGGQARSCGKCVRWLLCLSCNRLLGYARDNIETLKTAIIYLNQNETQNP